MATIQIRGIPEEDAEALRAAAAEAGMSLQAYMRREVSLLARRRIKQQAFAEFRAVMARDPSAGVEGDLVVETLRQLRGE
ncbi:FitA-like ribbon-helix-helix domain-containing protein [Nocardia brasiliensis]